MKKKIGSILLLVAALIGAGCSTLPYRHNPKDTVYGVFGDCYAAGAKAMPLSDSFASLTAGDLDEYYPHITLLNYGQGGGTIDSVTGKIQEDLNQVAQANKGPMEHAVLNVGIGDLQSSCACIVCDHPPTLQQGMDCAAVYKKKLQSCVDAILKFNPHCDLVLCTIPDPNDGGKGVGVCKPIKPIGILDEFNKSIREVAALNKVKVADVYTAFMGHPEYFVGGDVHPNNLGHSVIASLVDAQFGVTPLEKIAK